MRNTEVLYNSLPESVSYLLPKNITQDPEIQKSFNTRIIRWLLTIEMSFDIICRCKLYNLMETQICDLKSLKILNAPKSENFQTFTQLKINKIIDWSLENLVSETGDFVEGQIKQGIKILLMGAVAYSYGPIGGFFGFALKWVKIPINIASKVKQVYGMVKQRSSDLINLITNNRQTQNSIEEIPLGNFSEKENQDSGLFNFLIRDSIRNMTETNEEVENLIWEISKGDLVDCEKILNNKITLTRLILYIVENKNKKT